MHISADARVYGLQIPGAESFTSEGDFLRLSRAATCLEDVLYCRS